MPIIKVKELLESGIHFGHSSSRWNPKMAPYIFGKRNKIHIIDLRQTLRGLIKASHVLKKVGGSGGQVLFVGTKRQARDIIIKEANRCGMPFVADRWIGGTLTNLAVIRSRMKRLDEIEQIEQAGKIETMDKKEAAGLRRELRRLRRNLGGIRKMARLPEAIVAVDPRKEKIAVTEAKKTGVSVIALVDTDGDPDDVDIPIPGNDDALRSIEIVLRTLTDAIIAGGAGRTIPMVQPAATVAPAAPVALAGPAPSQAPAGPAH